MYTSFFGLNEKPFSITPDPRYLYLSGRHAEALAHLIYGVKESGGFIQLTGEVGTGKTTLVRSLLQQLPEFADVAVVLNSQLSRAEFLGSICEELHTELPEQRHSTKALTDVLNAYLLQNHSLGRRTILIVDEAQNLRRDVLEQIRLLTNLETAKQKLLQIILIGQPELREMLARNDLRQLAQRITGRYHLEPLSLHETGAYIDHRLQIAGAVSEIFPARAKRELFRLSGGVPRMINVIADRVLLGAYTQGDHRVTPELVRTAAGEVFDRPTGLRGWLSAGWNHPGRWAGMGVAGFLLVLGLGFAGSRWLPALTGANGADARSSDVTPVALPLQPLPPRLRCQQAGPPRIWAGCSKPTGATRAQTPLFAPFSVSGKCPCKNASPALCAGRGTGSPVPLPAGDSGSGAHPWAPCHPGFEQWQQHAPSSCFGKSGPGHGHDQYWRTGVPGGH